MKTYNEIFAENLTKLMREKGISQNELARQIGVSVGSVNFWCNAVNVPRPKVLDRLCEFFDVPQVELTTNKDDIPNLSIPAAYPLPILGVICAGDGILCNENFDGYFFVDNSIRADYCLRVEGDSMIDANIFHGDIAFIRKSYGFLDGGIYAVVFGDSQYAVLKKVYRQGKGLLLMPCNSKYDPISVEDAIIVGECIGVYHSRS